MKVRLVDVALGMQFMGKDGEEACIFSIGQEQATYVVEIEGEFEPRSLCLVLFDEEERPVAESAAFVPSKLQGPGKRARDCMIEVCFTGPRVRSGVIRIMPSKDVLEMTGEHWERLRALRKDPPA